MNSELNSNQTDIPISELMPSISLESLFHLPDWLVYYKDLKGKYVDCSVQAADLFQVTKDDLLNKADSQFPWRDDAKKWRHNELKVATTKTSLQFYEELTYLDKKYLFLSIKLPVHHRSKMAGTIGMHKIQQQTDLRAESSVIASRELECLYHLIKGLTLKQIAQIMRISARTVEHHINNAKTKLNCYRRSELIFKASQLPDIKNKLFLEAVKGVFVSTQS
jgi:DNA-binding CsgD family transcriptional regulator